MKNGIKTLLVAFLLAFIIFSSTEISSVELIIVGSTVALIGILSINVVNKQNRSLVLRIVLMFLGTIGAFIVNKEMEYLLKFVNVIEELIVKKDITPLFVRGLVIFAIITLIILCFSNIDDSSQNKNDLFPEREKDLEQIRKYLLNKDIAIIGIDASWGNGKSYLIEEIKRRYADKVYAEECEIVTIDILATNLDNILECILKELDGVLYRNEVFSRYSKKLNTFFSSNKSLEILYSFLSDDHSMYSKALYGFKQELLNLNKTILIVIEDVDRIQNYNLIMKIFYISEKLSSEKIKIIYQYDSNELKKIIPDALFLEKYIPYQIKLTRIALRNIVKDLLKKWKITEDVFKIDDLYRLPPWLYIEEGGLLNIEEIRKQCKIFFENKYRIRSVEHYIQEIRENSNFYLGKYTNEDNKQLLIGFFFIKHFMPDIFSLLSTNESLVDSLKIEYEGKFVDIPKIIERLSASIGEEKQDISNKERLSWLFNFRKNPTNFQKYLAFILLGLQKCKEPSLKKNNTLKKKNSNDDFTQRWYDIYNQTGREMLVDEKIKYKSIEQGVYYLLEKGNPKNINYVEHINSLLDIAESPKEEWNKKIKELNTELYSCNMPYDTIFLVGVQSWTQIFKAMFIASRQWETKVSDENYQKIISMFFNFFSDYVNFDIKIVQCLNFCWEGIIVKGAKRAFILLIDKLNELKIVGNMNETQSFPVFLERSIHAIYEFGYCERVYFSELNSNNYTVKGAIDSIQTYRGKLKSSLDIFEKYNVANLYSEEIKEYNIIIRYIDNMLTVVKNKNSLKEEPPHVEARIVDLGYDRIKKYADMDEETFNTEIKSSDLTPCEKIKIIKARNKTTEMPD